MNELELSDSQRLEKIEIEINDAIDTYGSSEYKESLSNALTLDDVLFLISAAKKSTKA